MPEGTETQQTETQTTTQTPPPETESKAKFTQEDLDRVVQERLSRATPKDYEDLKAKAAEFDKLQESQKTEVERAIARAEKAETKTTETEAKANAKLKRAAIIEAAANQSAADVSVVVALLVNDESIAIGKDDEITGADAAVKKLLKEKPFLVKGASTGASGGEFGGNDSEAIADRIAKAEASGDFDTAMRLKLAQNQGL